jgi:hypothetical protein
MNASKPSIPVKPQMPAAQPAAVNSQATSLADAVSSPCPLKVPPHH